MAELISLEKFNVDAAMGTPAHPSRHTMCNAAFVSPKPERETQTAHTKIYDKERYFT